MADLSDVEQAMVRTISGILMLGSKYVPGSSVVSPVTGSECRVYRGWPIANELEADVTSNVSNVSIFPVPGASRNESRYMLQWRPGADVAATLIATVSGNSVTFGGVPSVGQVAGVRLGVGNTGTAYAYRLRVGDTAAIVAAALAALVPGGSSVGPVLTLPSSAGLQARVSADQPSWLETRRQQQNLWVMCWCRDPLVRDKICGAIDAGFSGLTTEAGNLTEFIPLPDGSAARVCYVSTSTFDKVQQAGIWRRDLRYVVDYPTTLIQAHPRVLFTGGHIYDFDVSDDPIAEFGDLPAA